MGFFSYQPEFDYDSVEASNSAETTKHLLPFKGGFLKGLEPHLVNADNIQKFLASAPTETRKEINRRNKEIDAALVAIIRLYGGLEDELSVRQLDTSAHREYYTHFQNAEMEDAKLEFVKLIRSYEIIKHFNLELLETWTQLARIFESFATPSGEKQFLEQLLVYRVYPRIDLCNLTNLLLRRLAYILNAHGEENRAGKIHIQGQYSSQINYAYSVVFREDIADVLDGLALPKEGETKTHAFEPIRETRDSAIKSPYLLDTRGSESFNQTYAYILEIDPARFSLEEAKVTRSVYIETHLGVEDEALRQDLIRKFISAARNKDRAGEYKAFLMNYFQFTRETVLLGQTSIPEEDHLLFLYHFGPLFFIKIAAHFMRIGRTGYVHRHLKRNQMARELPLTYIKYVFKEWWDENIYTQLPRNERNSHIAFERLLTGIRDEWHGHHLKLLGKIRQDPDLRRALSLHDVITLGQFLEMETSYLYHVKILRFLGRDFFYLPLRLASEKSGSRK